MSNTKVGKAHRIVQASEALVVVAATVAGGLALGGCGAQSEQPSEPTGTSSTTSNPTSRPTIPRETRSPGGPGQTTSPSPSAPTTAPSRTPGATGTSTFDGTAPLETGLRQYAPKDGRVDLVKQKLEQVFGPEYQVERLDQYGNGWEITAKQAGDVSFTLTAWQSKLTINGPEGTPTVKEYRAAPNDGGDSVKEAVGDVCMRYFNRLDAQTGGGAP
jgi:hypothetical protein